jgi:protocatechuate 3,4-dioxygenase alpha subunit
MVAVTPSQTVGPFFAYALTPTETDAIRALFVTDLTVPGLAGTPIRIEGRVIDGDGAPIPDAVIEVWQADAAGAYSHAEGRQHGNVAFKGFGRAGTSQDGSFAFTTVKPGRVKDSHGTLQAPHIAVNILARGLLKQLTTRIYFGDEPANANDPILALVPPDRRDLLIAPARKTNGTTVYSVLFRLQEGPNGEPETVFFEA